MPVFAANLETLWTELHPMDRPAAAARAGFEWVEIPFPYDLNAADLRKELIRLGLRLALMACPPVGGGLASESRLIAMIDDAVRARVLGRYDAPLVVPGQHSRDGGLRGAAMLHLLDDGAGV